MTQPIVTSRVYNDCTLHFFQMAPNMTGDMTCDMEDMQQTIGCNHVLYTCGSGFGVDDVAEETAKDYGMQMETMKLLPHPRAKSSSPATVELLRTTDEAIQNAAVTLRRKVPSHFHTFSILQRNYHAVKKAHTVFAFGHIHPNRTEVRGGTGWTIQLALDQGKTVFVFDDDKRKWYTAERKYDVDPTTNLLKIRTEFLPWGSTELPTLHQSSAVVGSKLIDQNTEKEVKDLFHRTFCTVKNAEEFRKELEELAI